MRIRYLSFAGIRCLDGLARDLPRTKETDLVVFRAGHARGKTAFLDAIAAAKEAVANYGSPDPRWDALIDSKTGAAKVQLGWELSDDEVQDLGLGDPLITSESILGEAKVKPEYNKSLQGILGRRSTTTRGSIHYLHDTRTFSSPLSFGADEAAHSERLTARNAKFASLFDMLDQPGRSSSRALAGERLNELFPDLELGGLRRVGVSFEPYVTSRRTGALRTYSDLSSSEQQGFLAALYTAREPIVGSVVLVDAPERGFGDEGAVEYVAALLRWTTRTQIIVATASRAVAAMPETAHVLELA